MEKGPPRQPFSMAVASESEGVLPCWALGWQQMEMMPELGCVCARQFLSLSERGVWRMSAYLVALVACTAGGQRCLPEAEPFQHP